jgi:hypothetical protein
LHLKVGIFCTRIVTILLFLYYNIVVKQVVCLTATIGENHASP